VAATTPVIGRRQAADTLTIRDRPPDPPPVGVPPFSPDEFCRLLVEGGLFVVRFDHRDIGHSIHTRADYDLFTSLVDSLAVLDAHSVGAAHFVGHSMGGYIVALAAVHQAPRVLSATMISAGPTVTPAIAGELGLSSVRPETWEALV
jgi:pimeloyl-ACP methyl ester carboxylesterase